MTGVEGEILGIGNDLMLQYTLYVNPLPNPVALPSKMLTVRRHAQDEIPDAVNIVPSSKRIHIVRLRSQR